MRIRYLRLLALVSFSCLNIIFLNLASADVQTNSSGSAAVSNQCMEQISSLDHTVEHADSLLRLGSQCLTKRAYQAADLAWQTALDIYEFSGDVPGQITVLINLGNLTRELGHYSRSLDAFERTLYLLKDYDNDLVRAQTLSYLSRTLSMLGRAEEANQILQEALTLVQSTSNPTEEIKILELLGASYLSLRVYSEANHYYQRGLEIARQSGNELLMASLLNSVAFFESTQGNIRAAVENFRKSLAIIENYDLEEHRQSLLGNLCLVHLELDDDVAALNYCRDSLDIAQQIGNSRRLARAFNNLGFVYFKVGNLEEAEANATKAIAILEILFKNIADDPDSQMTLGDTLISYNLLQRILVAQHKHEEALAIAEQSRAKASVSLLTQRMDVEINISDIDEALSASDIQKIAKDNNAVIVEYSLILESYLNYGGVRGNTAEIYTWVIQPTGEINFHQTLLDDQDFKFQDIALQIQTSIGNRSRGGFELSDEPEIDQQAYLQALHELLIQPIAGFLPDDPLQQVVIIPQRELFSVPFAALRDATGQYLIEKHTLSFAPAAQMLQLAQEQKSPDFEQQKLAQKALIVGNPEMPMVRLAADKEAEPLMALPGAEQEALEIATLLGSSPLIGAQGKESTIKQLMTDASLIHLATHGLLEYGRPEDSGVRDIPGAIALTPDLDTQDDGLLTAAEILDMQLQANLVVLSACDTGLGTVTDDGVNGLSRSFIMAGVPSVVVSLWSVPDAPTTELMIEFYQQMQMSGNNKAQALRQAMLKTMEDHPDPRDWAAFTLIGLAE